MFDPERFRLSIIGARYLEALERGDRRTQSAIERQADADPAVADAIDGIRIGLVEEALAGDPPPE